MVRCPATADGEFFEIFVDTPLPRKPSGAM